MKVKIHNTKLIVCRAPIPMWRTRKYPTMRLFWFGVLFVGIYDIIRYNKGGAR